MRRNLKKTINFVLIAAFFCLAFMLPFCLSLATVSADENSSSEITISDKDDLQNYINNYGDSKKNDTIVLGADIDLSGVTLKGTIGTASAPFSGKFDGKGHKISNLNVNVSSETTATSAYAGLFGVTTTGATISNLALTGTVILKADNCFNAYVGALIGRATGTTVTNCQVTADIKYDSNLDNSINFGALIGYATDSNISNVICRSGSAGFGEWTFSSNNNQVMRFGGVIGTMNNSHLSFAVVSNKFNVQISDSFVGDISIGGIAGQALQGGSSIFNIAMENSFAIDNNSTQGIINIGQVVGSISVPAPQSKNFAYIYYKNNNIDRFGSMGGYAYGDESNFDFILPAIDSPTSREFFQNKKWHDFLGSWDFDTVWYFNSSTIYLQNFYGTFSIAATGTDEIVKATLEQTSYRYGDRVEIEFSFNSDNGVDLSNFYNPSALVLNGAEKAKIVPTAEGYRLSSSDSKTINAFQIEIIDKGLKVTVRSVNMFTAGTYSIATEAKSFKAEVTSRLYDADENLKEGSVPGYVFYAEGANTSTENLTLPKMTYGQVYRLATRSKQDLGNAFAGWFKEVEDDADEKLGSNNILEFTFGKEVASDCKIYAKYVNNARVVTFKLDDGVSKVVLDSGETTVKDNGQKVALSKTQQTIKLEIYINEGYDFDIEKLKTFVNTYTSSDSMADFCEFVSSNEAENGETCYQFSLDTNYLGASYADAFNIEISTTEIKQQDNSWIWILVGSVGGALVIGLVIILIVVLKRRGGGRMSGGGKLSKKSYKNMYY